ncbi:hypothetical protein BC940DRAFT_307989 [Gongronella butleri]|nr:hypothetical protein BC940DRAFT_307989 [Gongronella butleri]
MATETHMHDELYEDDAFAASLSLEDELMGKGYAMAAPLGSSLAAELHSATQPLEPLSPTPSSKLASLAMDRSLSSPLHPESPAMQTSTSTASHYDHPHQQQMHQRPSSSTSSSSTTATQQQQQQQQNGHLVHASPSAPYMLDNAINELPESVSDQTSPVMSPLQWSTFGRSRRSSFSSTWSSLEPEIDDDPFEVLKRQLEDLNSVVWESKTLHKRLTHTLAATIDDPHTATNASTTVKKKQPLEFVITSVAGLVESKSRDRERQTVILRNLENALRKEASTMPLDCLRELEHLVGQVKVTLYDQAYSYENPVPLLRHLSMDTSGMADSLEELKELMYVSKRQVTELNQRLRSIAKTVHEVRKDIRRINKFLEEKDDDDAIVLEKGEVQKQVHEIMWGLDDLDNDSSTKIRQMQLFWEEQIISSMAS